MSPHLILLAVLLLALVLLLWKQNRRTQFLPNASKLRTNLLPISVGIDTVGVPTVTEPAYRDFSARDWRMAVQVCLRRDGELMALKISRLFEKEFPGYFDDEDRAFQVRLRENIDKLQLAIAKHTALLAQPVPELSAYNNRGYTRILLGNYKQAISDFDRAIEVGSAEAYAYNNRGFAYLRLGQLSKALADIKHSLQLDPDNAYAHRNLGIYYYEQGDWQSALTNLEQSAQLGPNTPDLQGYLKLVKAHLA